MKRSNIANYHAALLSALILAFMWCGSCVSHKRVMPSGVTYHEASEYTSIRGLTKKQKEMIKEACSWQGTPYKYGGAEKDVGTDCSGLVLRVYLDVTGIKLPRNSAAQSDFCRSLDLSHIRPCDLVFFATGSNPGRVSHVGLMLDSENFIHSTSSKGVVVTRLDNPWWHKRIMGFGRVPGFK